MLFKTASRWLILLSVILFTVNVSAQITEDFLPEFRSEKAIHSIGLRWNFAAFKAVDTGSASVLPMAGYTSKLETGSSNDELWTETDVLKVWQLKLDVADADEIALYFSRFEPGADGKLFILSADGSVIKGAFTQQSRTKDMAFSIGPLRATELILQFETAKTASDFGFQLAEAGLLRSVSSGQGFGTSGNCEINVNCAEGLDWQRHKRGVARIVVKQGSALYYCSGSLINNARADATPFFLTANHCGEYASANDYAQWIFAFNYETPGCEKPGTEPLAQTMTGALMLAKAVAGTDQGSDFKLLQLLQDLPPAYNAYYNGWSRQNAASASGVGIHHPDGDVKKISTYTSAVVSANYGFGGSNPAGKYWRVNWSSTANGHGVTEGGSSGSPLFDQSGRIIGALTGGSSSCSQREEPDFYGKFSYSWESNGTDAANQLAPWLDPDNTGLEFLGGLGSDTLFVEADFETERTELSMNQFVVYENLSAGKIGKYEWFFEGGKPATSNLKSPGPVLYENYGNFDVKLIVSNEMTSDTLLRKDYISVKPFLFPNPSAGSFELAFGVDITADVALTMTDVMGREVPFYAEIKSSRISIRLANPARGTYIIHISDKSIEKILKFVVAY